jgi:hypothetical protein
LIPSFCCYYHTPLILRGHKGKALILNMKETKK